jgi:phosphoglycerol transferase
VRLLPRGRWGSGWRATAIDCLLISIIAIILVWWIFDLADANRTIALKNTEDGRGATAIVKGIDETGWWTSNPDLNAPFGAHNEDFPFGGDSVHFVALKLIMWFIPAGHAGLGLNIHFVGGFAVVACTAYFVMRLLRIPRLIAALLGLAYSFLPYHLWHGIDHWPSAPYFTAPLVVLLLLLSFQPYGRLLRNRPDGSGRLRIDRRVALAVAALCVLIGLTEHITTFFALSLFAVMCPLRAVIRRDWRLLAVGGAMAALIAGAFLVGNAQSLMYWAAHGRSSAGVRGPAESQAFGLRIDRLLMPAESNRVPALRRIGTKIATSPYVESEGGQALGFVGAIGFLGALVHLFVRRSGRGLRRRSLADGIGAIVFAALFIGTMSGLGTVVAELGFTQVRTWNRIVVIIGFGAFTMVAIWLARLWAWARLHSGRRRARVVVTVVAVFLTALAIFDMGTPGYGPRYYAAQRAEAASDTALVDQAQRLLPKGSSIFEFPPNKYPESPQRAHELGYDDFRPYNVSSTLKWSFGGVSGRPETDWKLRAEQLPLDQVLPAIAGMGYSGIWVIRSGYDDDGRAFEATLASLVGAAPLVSPDGSMSFWDLRPYTTSTGLSDEQLRDAATTVFQIAPPSGVTPVRVAR